MTATDKFLVIQAKEGVRRGEEFGVEYDLRSKGQGYRVIIDL